MGVWTNGLLVLVTAVSVKVLPSYFKVELPLHFDGQILDPRFENVEAVFKKNFYKGEEKEGAAFAVYHKGKLVVDLWGGYADKSSNRKWKNDTTTVIFSSTKAGLASLDSPISETDVYDWKIMSKKFEDQVPNWFPGLNFIKMKKLRVFTSHDPSGRGSGYHALTYGWLVDSLFRRVEPKNRSIGQFFDEEIAKPFGVDFYLGLPRDQMYRVSHMTPPTMTENLKIMTSSVGGFFYTIKTVIYGTELMKTLLKNPDWLWKDVDGMKFNDPEIWEMEIGAANGITNARGLAKIFSLLLEGKLIKNRKVLERLTRPVLIKWNDRVLNLPITFACGYMLTQNRQGDYIFGHPGYGGNNIKADIKNNLAFAYVTNGIQPGMGDLTRTFMRLQSATYQRNYS